MKCNSLLNVLLFILFSAISIPLQAQKIGLVMDSYVIDRWYLDQKLFSDKIRELGGEVKIEVAYGDPAEQLRLSKKLIEEGVKALVIVPVDGHKSIAIVEAAKAANIPVISYDRLILSNDVTVYISYNNEKVGELQAQYALNKVPAGHYLLLNGPESDNNASLFRKGQLKILKPGIDSGKIKIIGDFILDDWGEIGSLIKVDEFFSATKVKPEVIIAANDAFASGTIQAIPPELKGKIIITGQDADLTALKNIVSGAQSMTIYKPIKPLAYLAAETAIQLAKGEPVKNKIKLQTSDITVEAILLDPVTVDKANYKETVVKDGHVSLSELMEKK